MSTITNLMVFTVSALFTMTITTPGLILVGFKLRAAMMVAVVGLPLTVFTSDIWINYNDWQVIHERVLNTQVGWLTIAWLILLVPYSKAVRTRRKELAAIYNRK